MRRCTVYWAVASTRCLHTQTHTVVLMAKVILVSWSVLKVSKEYFADCRSYTEPAVSKCWRKTRSLNKGIILNSRAILHTRQFNGHPFRLTWVSRFPLRPLDFFLLSTTGRFLWEETSLPVMSALGRRYQKMSVSLDICKVGNGI